MENDEFVAGPATPLSLPGEEERDTDIALDKISARLFCPRHDSDCGTEACTAFPLTSFRILPHTFRCSYIDCTRSNSTCSCPFTPQLPRPRSQQCTGQRQCADAS